MDSKKTLSFWKVILLSSLLFIPKLSLAQGLNLGLGEIGQFISLGGNSPIVIALKIINFALFFLGIIAVGLIIYAGFIWMTSAGNKEKIDKASNTLKNAAIGLAIILASWGITLFVLNRLALATGANLGQDPGSQYRPPSLIGTGTIGACSVESVYPENGQKNVARNTSIMASFKEPLDLSSVCVDQNGVACACNQSTCNSINPAHIRVYQKDFGDDCSALSCPDDSTNISDIEVQISSDKKTIVMMPRKYLGNSNFLVDYEVKIMPGLLKENGESMFKTCQSDWLAWGFQVSNLLDLTPPQVKNGGVFPPPDNIKDVQNQSSEARAATARIDVNSCPKSYQEAQILSVESGPGSSPASAWLGSSYSFQFSRLTVKVSMDSKQAQLFSGSDLLGVATWQDDAGEKLINFPQYFSLKTSEISAGNTWTVNIRPESIADRLTVAQEIYFFTSNINEASLQNSIYVPSDCGTGGSLTDLVNNIASKLSNNKDVELLNTNNLTINLKARKMGEAGNNLGLMFSGDALRLQAFSGGTDSIINLEIKDKKDQPMNSIIQINFNEAINPILVSGPADLVSNQIRVRNAKTNKAGGAACSADNECDSYRCRNGLCAGDHLAGEFRISNLYKTVEFISDIECGLNSCGEKIYCLPPDSNLKVELRAADLKTCNTDEDCLAFHPFSNCAESELNLGYKTCQDMASNNYPSAGEQNGIVDAANNSLDGNRSVFSDGPFAYFNENAISNPSDRKDNFTWSFFISSVMNLSSPEIAFIDPINAEMDIEVNKPIRVNFNTLMMKSSLRTGLSTITSGGDKVEHHLINIFSSAPSSLGYWISSEDRDIDPADGQVDRTFVTINHSDFDDSVSYNAQIGSGVKDIYQNCYKPSSGPNCQANELNPSCCFGISTDTLDSEGNCLAN